MPDAHANFSYSLVTVAPSPAASGLSMTVADGSVMIGANAPGWAYPAGFAPLASAPLPDVSVEGFDSCPRPAFVRRVFSEQACATPMIGVSP